MEERREMDKLLEQRMQEERREMVKVLERKMQEELSDFKRQGKDVDRLVMKELMSKVRDSGPQNAFQALASIEVRRSWRGIARPGFPEDSRAASASYAVIEALGWACECNAHGILLLEAYRPR